MYEKPGDIAVYTKEKDAGNIKVPMQARKLFVGTPSTRTKNLSLFVHFSQLLRR